MKRNKLTNSLVPIPLGLLLLSTLAISTAQGQNKGRIDGIVKPFRTLNLSTSLREIIAKIHVSEGQRVEPGQILVELQSNKQKFAVNRLKELTKKAEYDHRTVDSLYAKKVASREEVLARRTELMRLKAELGIAEADVAERTLAAPFRGVVVERFKEPAESTTENDPILRIVETDRLLLLFLLDATLLPKVKMGQNITVQFPQLPALAKTSATIHFIDPEVDPRSGLFRVRLLLDNRSGKIRPGLRVRGEFPQ